VVSFFFFDGEHERAKKRFVREKILGEPPQRRRRIVVFRFGSGTPNVFARCSPRTRGARVGAPAPDGRTLRSATVPRRSTSHTVPCLVDASPRVMTTSCPNKDCGSRGANRQENEEAFAHVLSSSLKMCASRRGCGDAAETLRVRHQSIAKPETRVTHLEMCRVQPRQRLLARRTMRKARGSREGAGQKKDARVQQTVARENNAARPRRKRARVRVSPVATKYRLPRAHLARPRHRHSVSRGLFPCHPRVLASHRPFARRLRQL
jgi:hypothetical protein